MLVGRTDPVFEFHEGGLSVGQHGVPSCAQWTATAIGEPAEPFFSILPSPARAWMK